MWGQFGNAGVYDSAKLNLPITGQAPPGATGKDNDRSANVPSRSRFVKQERGKGRKGNTRNANVTKGGS